MSDTLTNPENITESAGLGDAITATASPRPWRVETNRFGQHYVVCDSGSGDPVRDYIAGPIQNEADAALIVDAVNYYKPDLHCDWRELTPEEAVAHCREVATRLGDTPCARDHLQLAEWIEERDRLRKKWEQSARKLVESEAALYNETKRRVAAEAERDRLRDIVRRSLLFVEGAIDGVSTILGNAEMLQVAGEGAPPKDVLEAFIADGRRVLRDARAAIGEDK